MKTVLLTGQSNARGAGAGGTTGWPGVSVWNNVNMLGTDGTAWVPPVIGSPPFNVGLTNNLGLSFCKAMSADLHESVRLTLVYQNATPIEAWIKSDDGSSPLTDEIIAVWTAQGTGKPYDVLLWMQGENNSTENYATYNPKFQEMLGLLSAAGVIDGITKIVVGGLDENQPTGPSFNTGVLQQIAADYSQVHYASSTGLPVDYTGGVWHYSGQGLYDFGYRFWDAVKERFMGHAPCWVDKATGQVFWDDGLGSGPIAVTPGDTIEDWFTPTLVGSTTAGSATYTKQYGKIARQGREADLHIALNFSGHTGTGFARIPLPFGLLCEEYTKLDCLVQSIVSPAGTFVAPFALGGYIFLNSQALQTGVCSPLAMDAAGEIYISGKIPLSA